MVLAERCALVSAEILKSQGKYSEAATLLIKMTSEVRNPQDCRRVVSPNETGFSFVLSRLPDQDSDLRSALLLEQAAHCFINMRTRMLRKFAFHMILAGHRFSKAGQVSHRCSHMKLSRDASCGTLDFVLFYKLDVKQ